MEYDGDDALSKYQQSFDQMNGKIHILEEQVPVEEQMLYFQASKNWRHDHFGRQLPSSEADCNSWFETLTVENEELDVEAKKELLLRLANSKSPLAFRLLKQYVAAGPGEGISDWAHLALLELEIALEADFSDERQIYISTGLGGKNSKLRFYILLYAVGNNTFEEYQQNIIRREFTYYFPQKDCELEELDIHSNYVEMLLLIPFRSNIRKILGTIITECNEYGNFIAKSYTITNVKRLSEEEILEVLAKKDEDDNVQESRN